MNKHQIILFVITLLFSLSSNAQSWVLDDAHSNLQFSVTNLMVAEIEGSIQIKRATLTTTSEDFSDAALSLHADMNTIDTDNDARDEHLRSPDFFDTNKYPDMTFQSTMFKKVSDNKYSVTGNLTFHGITKPVNLDVIATKNIRPYDNKEIVGFKASGTILRTDFRISTDTPSAILSDEVTIKGNVVFLKE